MTRAELRVLAAVEESALAWEIRAFADDFRRACERDATREHCRARVSFYSAHGDLVKTGYEYSQCFTATTLLKELQTRATPNNREKLPKSANHLGRELHRISAGLQMKKVQLLYKRHRFARLWELKVVVTKTL